MSEQPITWRHQGALVKVLLADGLMRCSACYQAAFTMVELARMPCERDEGTHRVQTHPIYDGRQVVAWCAADDWLHVQPYPDGDLGELALSSAIAEHVDSA